MPTINLEISELRALLQNLDLPTTATDPNRTLGEIDDYMGIPQELRHAFNKIEAATRESTLAPCVGSVTSAPQDWFRAPWACGHNDPIYRGPTAQECSVCHAVRTDPDQPEAPRDRFRWLIEIEVDKTWVEDGFDVDNERALDMLAHDLTYATIGTELDARVVARPADELISVTQGYGVDEWRAKNERSLKSFGRWVNRRTRSKRA